MAVVEAFSSILAIHLGDRKYSRQLILIVDSSPNRSTKKDPHSLSLPNPMNIDVILPAHNEGASIGSTLEEFYQIVAVEQGLPIRFIVCEDGSRNNTVDIIREKEGHLPVLLISENYRKGYARAN